MHQYHTLGVVLHQEASVKVGNSRRLSEGIRALQTALAAVLHL
jgi:hypothetical protein